MSMRRDDHKPGTDLDRAEFTDNPDPRCACVLLLDKSASMEGAPIRALNEGVNAFKAALEGDNLASLRVETAIVAFAGKAETVQDFVTVDAFPHVSLDTEWTGTSIAAAVNAGIDMVEERKNTYKQAGVSYYRPWIVLITDGASTEDKSKMDEVSERVRDAEEAKQLALFAIGVDGADMDELNRLAPRGAMPLNGLAFREFFVWLSRSMTRVSGSQVDDEVSLPAPAGWTTL